MGNKEDLPWVEKYRPKSAEEMVGFKNNILKIKQFLRNFEKKSGKGQLSEKERAILLEGPPGVGKTTVVYAVANDLGYSVIEMNASDVRTESTIKKKLGDSIGNTNLLSFMGPESGIKRRKKIILIDEVDGISGRSDRGGLSTLLQLIKKTQNPIIMTCNFYDSKFSSLYNIADKIKCNRLKKQSVLNLLKEISSKEKLNISDSVLRKITDNSGGDIRSSINDLQGFVKGSLKDISNIDMHRDIEEKAYEFMTSMFQAKSLLEAKKVVSNIDLDYNILHNVVFANIFNFIKNNEDLASVMKILAETDDIMGKIRKNMDFSLLPYYFDLVSGGVVYSVDFASVKGFKRFQFPRFRRGGSSYADDPVAEELQKQFHLSKQDLVMSIITYLADLIKLFPESEQGDFKNSIINEFNLNEKDLKKFL